MNIIFEHRRHGTRAVDLRWAAALAFAAAAFSACGSDPPERQGATNNAEAAEQRVLYEHIDNEADTRAELAEAQARARQERSARLIG